MEFIRHIMPDKVLVALAKIFGDVPERFASCPDVLFLDRFPTPEEADGFLRKLDTLFCIEEPYDWSLLDRAREKQVRTVLRINYEYLPELKTLPDVMIAPIDWYQPEGTIILPFPVNRQRFPFRKRTQAHTFIHVAGHLGMHGRNGTKELVQAIPMVKADVRFIIYSQRPLDSIRIDDPRIDWRIQDVPDNAVLYQEGDMMVLPRLYGGQALPLNEALSVGMPVIMSDMRPQSAFLPKELLVPCETFDGIHLVRTVEKAVIDPAKIAIKIDEWANRDISAYSEWANIYAESISWETLLPKYLEILCPERLASPRVLDSNALARYGAGV